MRKTKIWFTNGHVETLDNVSLLDYGTVIDGFISVYWHTPHKTTHIDIRNVDRIDDWMEEDVEEYNASSSS